MNKNGHFTVYFNDEQSSTVNEKYGKSAIFPIKL